MLSSSKTSAGAGFWLLADLPPSVNAKLALQLDSAVETVHNMTNRKNEFARMISQYITSQFDRCRRFAILMAFATVLTSCANGRDWQDDRAAERDEEVRENMRSVQVAAEHYAADHHSVHYPTAIDDDFKTYFRGGVEGQTAAPVGLVNPFTSKNEFPTLGTLDNPVSARSGPRFEIKPGAIQYCPLANGRGYAVVGGAHDGKALMDIFNPGQILVLTNASR
jgi:hypothetical protein